jgi:hypothetical protein
VNHGKERPLVRIGVYHLLELHGITLEESKALARIRMGICDEMQAVFDKQYQYLAYHLIAEVLVIDAAQAIEATSHLDCNWIHNVEVEKYYPTQMPPRSTRIGDVLKIGMHFLAVTTLNEELSSKAFFPTASAVPTVPTVTVKQRRIYTPPSSGHVWRGKPGEQPDVQHSTSST